MKQLYLYIDDERSFSSNLLGNAFTVIICRSYHKAIDVLLWAKENKWETWLDFGEKEMSYDLCKFIAENQIPLMGYKTHNFEDQDIDQFFFYYGFKKF